MLKEAAVLLNDLELDTERYRSAYKRSDIFGKAAKLIVDSGSKENLQELEWEFLLFRLDTHNGKSKKRFAPLMQVGGQVFPDINTFTPQQIDYYQQRANVTKNPIHKARYCDFIWEIRNDYVYAKTAIESYLECAEIFSKNKWERELVDALQRAAGLALTLNDKDAVCKVSLALVNWIDALNKELNFRWCLELIESLILLRKFLKGDELERVVMVAKAAVEFYKETEDGFHLQRSFLEVLMQLMNTLKKPEQALEFAIQIADSFEKEADWKLTHYSSGDLVAAHFYQQAAVNYRELGQRAKTNELLMKVKEHTEKAEASFTEFSFPITFPMEPITKYINELTLLDLHGALLSISNNNYFVPDVRVIRAQVNALKGKSAALIFSTLRIRDGNPVLRSATEDELIEEQVINGVVMEYKVKTSVFGEVIDSLIQKKGLNSAFLVSYLFKFKAFEKSSRELIQTGFERYFAEDYVSCLHILVPQLENVLRTILYNLGVSTTVMDKDSIQEKPLGAIWRETKIALLLGESMVYYVRSVLDDKRGANLRNDIAHGLISLDDCSKNAANTIFHIYLLLTRFTFNYGLCYGMTMSDTKALE